MEANDPRFMTLVSRLQACEDVSEAEAMTVLNDLHIDDCDAPLTHVLRFHHDFPPELRRELLVEAWILAANTPCHGIDGIVAAFREVGFFSYGDDPTPTNTLVVYRGIGPDGVVRGVSWTTIEHRTRLFARRRATTDRPGRVYVATIPPVGVLALLGRFENEVVFDPAHLADVRLLHHVGPKREVWR